jgi:hypothetical protein
VGCLAKQECVDDVYIGGPPTPHEERMSLRIIINIPNLMVGFMNNIRSSSKKIFPVPFPKKSPFRRPAALARQRGEKPESRVPGENRDPVLEMVPDFRRNDVWMPPLSSTGQAPQVRHDVKRHL